MESFFWIHQALVTFCFQLQCSKPMRFTRVLRAMTRDLFLEADWGNAFICCASNLLSISFPPFKCWGSFAQPRSMDKNGMICLCGVWDQRLANQTHLQAGWILSIYIVKFTCFGSSRAEVFFRSLLRKPSHCRRRCQKQLGTRHRNASLKKAQHSEPKPSRFSGPNFQISRSNYKKSKVSMAASNSWTWWVQKNAKWLDQLGRIFDCLVAWSFDLLFNSNQVVLWFELKQKCAHEWHLALKCRLL